MIDSSMFTVSSGSYRFAPKGAITDQVLIDVANRYEQQVMRKIAFVFPDQLGQRFSGTNQVLETTKYDGEGVFIYFEKDKYLFCFSPSSGRTRLGFAALDNLKSKLNAGVKKALFRAELYLANINGVRENVGDVIRVSFSNNQEDINRLHLAVFDMIMLDGEDYQVLPFDKTWAKIGDLLAGSTNDLAHRAEGGLVGENEIEKIFNTKIESGQEGIVVRVFSRNEIYKIKPRRTIDAVVIGYVEGELENGHGITSLLTALNYPLANQLVFQTLVRIGSGFTDEQRISLLSVLESSKINPPIIMTDSDGRSVHFIKPELIVEVSCEDLIETSASNKTNLTQVFKYEAGSYTFEGMSVCPRPTFATFVKLREDKTLAAGGARFSQISSATAPTIKKSSTSKPQILRREVYLKGEMVRKLLLIKNENDTVPFPYLIYWTDYSSKRKDPLKVDFESAATIERAELLCKKLIDENIVKGWAPM